VIKKQYTVDPFDILKGAGEFRYDTKEELLKTWAFVNATNYDLTLKKPEEENDSNVVILTKKNIKANADTKPPILQQGLQTFDDGLIYSFENQRPKHVTFSCKTDNEDDESCDFKMFNINKTGSTYVNEKLTKVS